MSDPLATILGDSGTVSTITGLTTPTFDRHGDEFSLRWSDHEVELWLMAAAENSHGIHAELAVKHSGVEIHWGRLNLVSTSGREAVVKKLAAVESAVPWRLMLERACRVTAAAMRKGAPTILLRARPATGPRYLIEPVLPLGETSILFGDGGSGKGFTAVEMALATKTGATLPGGLRALHRGEVLYLDYEGDAGELEDRFYRAARGLGVSGDGIHYRRMTRALADEAALLRAEISRLGITLVVVDSVAPAAGPEPEGADAANRTMNALRSFGNDVTRLVIAHMTHLSAQQKAGGARPFGSVFYWNLARSVWELRRSDDDGGDDLVVGLYHRKANRGRLHPPIGLRFAFGPDAIILHRADLGEAPDLLARASLPQRIRTVLVSGAQPAEVITAALEGASEDTVRRTLRRLAGRGQVLRLEDNGQVRWGLPA